MRNSVPILDSRNHVVDSLSVCPYVCSRKLVEAKKEALSLGGSAESAEEHRAESAEERSAESAAVFILLQVTTAIRLPNIHSSSVGCAQAAPAEIQTLGI
jgi:hypothetical protein